MGFSSFCPRCLSDVMYCDDCKNNIIKDGKDYICCNKRHYCIECYNKLFSKDKV